VKTLCKYSARCIDTTKAPKTFAIRGEDGVCKYPSDQRPEPYLYGHAQFLLENRTDFGLGLWDGMVRGGGMSCAVGLGGIILV
jgi:hypothetical protein